MNNHRLIPSLAAGLILLLAAAPARSAEPNAGGSDSAAPTAPAPGSPQPAAKSAGGGGAEDGFRIRIKLKDSPQGEFTCKGGERKGDTIEYSGCKHSELSKYGDEAIKMKIVEKAKYDTLDDKAKKVAAKLAFLKRASKAAKDAAKAAEGKAGEGQAAKDSVERAKTAGAAKAINKELRQAMDECRKDKSGALSCEGGQGNDAEKAGAADNPPESPKSDPAQRKGN